MVKYKILILIFTFMVLLTSCSAPPNTTEQTTYSQTSASDETDNYDDKEDNSPKDVNDSSELIDLSHLEKNTAFAQLYAIYLSPEEYKGRKIRIKGEYQYIQVYNKNCNNNDSKPGCIIYDQMGCCSIGLEFDLGSDHIFPNNYPSKGQTITLQGTLETYKNDDSTIPQLTNSRLIE